VTDKYGVYRRIDGGRGRRVGDLKVDDFIREPFLEARDALVQVAPRLELGVGNREDGDFGKRMLEDGLEVRREGSCVGRSAWDYPSLRLSHTKCVVTALYNVSASFLRAALCFAHSACAPQTEAGLRSRT
jgi:hypothetical protein